MPRTRPAWTRGRNALLPGKNDGLEEFHLLVHQPDSVHTPETSRQFARLVHARAGLKVQAPVDVGGGSDGANLFSGF